MSDQKIIDALYLTIGKKQVAIESLSRERDGHKANFEHLQGEYKNLLNAVKCVVDGDIEPDRLEIDANRLTWRMREDE